MQKGGQVMGKTRRWNSLVFVLAFLILVASPSAFAKKTDNGTPPGWSHGKKTGWHGADKPPGFEKKEHKHKKHHSKHHKKEKEEKEEKEKKNETTE